MLLRDYQRRHDITQFSLDGNGLVALHIEQHEGEIGAGHQLVILSRRTS